MPWWRGPNAGCTEETLINGNKEIQKKRNARSTQKNAKVVAEN